MIGAAALMAGGAGAGSQSPLALPRQRHAVHVGHRLGAVRQLQPAPHRALDRHGRTSVRDALPLRPARGQVHPVARDERQVGRPDVRPHAPPRREVERRQAVHRCGREVHVRDRQARGLASTRRCGRRASRGSTSRATPSASSSRGGRTTSTGTRTCTRSRSCHGTSGRATARPRSRPATPTPCPRWSAPARSATAPARARPARCSGTAGTTGGPRRRSESGCRCSTSSTSTTRRTPRRCRTSCRTTST